MVVANNIQTARARVFFDPDLVSGIDQIAVPFRLSAWRFERQERLPAFRVTPQIFEWHHFLDAFMVAVSMAQEDSATLVRVVPHAMLADSLDLSLVNLEWHGLRGRKFGVS